MADKLTVINRIFTFFGYDEFVKLTGCREP